MRVRIIFGLTNRGSSVPFHHQALLSELVRDLQSSIAPEFASYSLLSFSGLKGQTKVGKGGLHFFSSKVTLVFTSPNEEFLNALMVALFNCETVNVGNLVLIPEYIEKENLPEFVDEMKYICISPVVLTGPNTEGPALKDFVSPFDDVFSDYLYESTMTRMELSDRFTSEDVSSFFKFQIVPDRKYLEKLQQNGKKFSRTYTTNFEQESRDIRGYTLPFTLFADKQVQQFLFECGIGEYAQNGFGMLDLANVNPLGRIERHEIAGVSFRD